MSICTCIRIDCWHEKGRCDEPPTTRGGICTTCRYHRAPVTTDDILAQVATERRRQDEMFPGQFLPSGTSPEWEEWQSILYDMRYLNDSVGPTWASVLTEEVAEVMVSGGYKDLRAELIQVAAVAVRWIEQLDQGLA